MHDTTQSALTPARSLASFDAAGRLLDWNHGFASEFAGATDSIAAGVLFRALVGQAFAGDEAIVSILSDSPFDPLGSLDSQPNGSAGSRVFDYCNRAGQFLRVHEDHTQSGVLIRVAYDVTAERRSNAAFAKADETWCVDGDPTAEATHQIRIEADGRFLNYPWSENARTVWGLPSDFDLSDPAGILSRFEVTEEEEFKHRLLFAEIARSLKPMWLDARIRDGDNKLRWLRFSTTAKREASGGTLITVVQRDITRAKLAEDQLELLRSAVTHATDGIQILHTAPDGLSTIIYANPAFELATGWPVDELMGRPVTAMSGWEGCWERLQALAAGDDDAVIELQAPRRDGAAVWFEVSVKVLERRSEGSKRWVVVSRNIDDRRRVQEELHRARDEAESANRTKSEFLANMSHEIRTPMSGVIGMTALLLRTDLTADQRKFAAAVQTSADSLLEIINDILDVSKLEAGKIELEAIDFSLETVVEDVVELLSAKALEKGLEIACHVDETARRPLRGDPSRLRQVCLNLLSNSLKFTDRGFVSLEVRSTLNDDGRVNLRLDVHDTGIGLSAEAKSRLFTKFQQADSSITRRFGGTGLGLSICRQLVELMGGRIGVDDRQGGGTTFWVEVALEPARSSSPAGPNPVNLTGRRILVVDDIELNRHVFSRRLQAGGAIVEEADSGDRCLEALAVAAAGGRPYDLVLIDHMMPGMAGDELAERIRARGDWPQPRLVLASSICAPLSADRAAKAGFDAFLTKPVRNNAFLDCMDALFRTGAEAKIACKPGRASPAAGAVSSPPDDRGRVLLADDHEINRLLASTLLKQAGYRVECAADGALAVEAAGVRQFDLILMDVQMPVMDGLQATRRIRALDGAAGSVPIVAMTASAMQGDRDICRAAGMDDYVSKPFDPEDFLRMVAKYIPDDRAGAQAAPLDADLDDVA